ncbi:cyclin-K isoform X2 [Pseudorca crassidens]|uniref:cyclin-K isoform X2 n=1 Tax=Pseudorca crassidens TaxID=82174 RepID=UPI00352F3096
MKENKENSSPSVTSANLDHTKPCWYWDKKDLAHTPSQLEGLDPATEARYRREGARFIFDVGTRLGLHYDTLATGIIYFHRFYMFHSFKQFPRYVTGACCLFLAGKVEETPKKCKDIIKTARSLLNDVQFGQFGDDPKEEVMVLERILLQTIKFDLQVEHPYQFLLKYAKQLKGDKNKIQKLVQMAWTFVNDSLCTTLSLQWEPEIIAVAVMYLAGRLCKFEIQEWTSKPMYRRWWEQFVQDVPVDVLEDICHQILDLYSQGKQQMPHHTPHQLQQPPPLQPTPQAPQVPQSQPAQGSELPQPPQKDSQQPAQPQPPPPAQQPKKPSPQPSPPRQAKRAVVVSPKEENKASEPPPPKIPKIEPPHPPLPPAHPPPGVLPNASAARRRCCILALGSQPLEARRAERRGPAHVCTRKRAGGLGGRDSMRPRDCPCLVRWGAGREHPEWLEVRCRACVTAHEPLASGHGRRLCCLATKVTAACRSSGRRPTVL